MSPEDAKLLNDVLAIEAEGRRLGAVGAVREAIEQHRDEVLRLVGWDRFCRPAATLDCLLALVEGKPWPPGGGS